MNATPEFMTCTELFNALPWIADVEPENMEEQYRSLLDLPDGNPRRAFNKALDELYRRADPFETMNICCRHLAFHDLLNGNKVASWVIRRAKGSPSDGESASSLDHDQARKEVVCDDLSPSHVLFLVHVS